MKWTAAIVSVIRGNQKSEIDDQELGEWACWKALALLVPVIPVWLAEEGTRLFILSFKPGFGAVALR